MTVKVIGAGLAGCEAAWQLAKEGIKVDLYEMKPKKFSPAHSNENFAELVCSNSLKADRIENACGLLKEEMRFFDSVMMEAADKCRVPAGGALAVDREMFSACITEKIKAHGLITVVNEEVVKINPDEYATQMIRVIDEPKLRRQLSIKGYARYLSQYTARQMVSTTVALYNKLITQ